MERNTCGSFFSSFAGNLSSCWEASERSAQPLRHSSFFILSLLNPGGQLTLAFGSADNLEARQFSALREVISGFNQEERSGRTRPQRRQPSSGRAKGVCSLVQRRRGAKCARGLEQGAAHGVSQAGRFGRRVGAPQSHAKKFRLTDPERSEGSISLRSRLTKIGAGTLLMLAVGVTACGPKHPYASAEPPIAPAIQQPEQPAEPEAPVPVESSNNSSVDVPRSLSIPTVKPVYVEEGIASWYGPPYHNRRGSNGEIYDMHAMTAAHRTLPLNSLVRVTNIATHRSAIVRITDRGPFIKGRMLDLSLAAAQAVDVWRAGLARVRIEVLETPAPIDRGGRWCVQIGAFQSAGDASELKEKLQARYHTTKVLQFTGPTGEWLRVRVSDDDKHRAESLAAETKVDEGGVFLVRLD